MKLKHIDLGEKYFVKSRAKRYRDDGRKMKGKWVKLVELDKREVKHPKLFDEDGNKYDPSNIVWFDCDEVTCAKCPLYKRDRK